MKIIDIGGNKKKENKFPPPDADVIKFCENLLDLAKTGELQSIDAVCGTENDVWFKGVCSNTSPSYFTVIGGIQCMLQEKVDSFAYGE